MLQIKADDSAQCYQSVLNVDGSQKGEKAVSVRYIF